jgi:hypothetical protein
MLQDFNEVRRLLSRRGDMAVLGSVHRPINHHRYMGHMDKKVSQMARGGDNRTRLQNAVSVMRRMRDNDNIIVERPLG